MTTFTHHKKCDYNSLSALYGTIHKPYSDRRINFFQSNTNITKSYLPLLIVRQKNILCPISLDLNFATDVNLAVGSKNSIYTLLLTRMKISTDNNLQHLLHTDFLILLHFFDGTWQRRHPIVSLHAIILHNDSTRIIWPSVGDHRYKTYDSHLFGE